MTYESADEMAEVMLLQEFKEACAVGAYTDDDGCGYLGDADRPSKISISCVGDGRVLHQSKMSFAEWAKAAGYTHVWWYSK